MHGLRVDFRIARFLNKSDYENILRMQGMLALAIVRGASRPAFADSVHPTQMRAIGPCTNCESIFALLVF
jgi:hypothetical protein